MSFHQRCRDSIIRQILMLFIIAAIFGLSSCSTPATRYSITITGNSVPVVGYITEPDPYPGGDLAGIDFYGAITDISTGEQLELSNFMYPNLGSDRLACTGEFSRDQGNTTFSFPLNCTNGRHGTANITIEGNTNISGQTSYLSLDGHSARVGIGSFQLVDKSSGEFAFGDTTINVLPSKFPDSAVLKNP
jgi:hypothetical protein